MTLSQLESLAPLVAQYTAKGWDFVAHKGYNPSDDGVNYSYGVLSPRMIQRAFITFPFDEFQLQSFEALSVARQTHEKAINTALHAVKEDMLKELALLYGPLHGKAPIPREITVSELRVPLYEEAS